MEASGVVGLLVHSPSKEHEDCWSEEDDRIALRKTVSDLEITAIDTELVTFVTTKEKLCRCRMS